VSEEIGCYKSLSVNVHLLSPLISRLVSRDSVRLTLSAGHSATIGQPGFSNSFHPLDKTPDSD
jgi:hypothetical protein